MSHIRSTNDFRFFYLLAIFSSNTSNSIKSKVFIMYFWSFFLSMLKSWFAGNNWKIMWQYPNQRFSSLSRCEMPELRTKCSVRNVYEKKIDFVCVLNTKKNRKKKKLKTELKEKSMHMNSVRELRKYIEISHWIKLFFLPKYQLRTAQKINCFAYFSVSSMFVF